MVGVFPLSPLLLNIYLNSYSADFILVLYFLWLCDYFAVDVSVFGSVCMHCLVELMTENYIYICGMNNMISKIY